MRNKGKEGWRKNIKHKTYGRYRYVLCGCILILHTEQGDAKEIVEGLHSFGWIKEAFLRRYHLNWIAMMKRSQ